MNCIHCEEQLSAYLEDALSGAERAAVEAHLHSCEACSELLEGVRQVIQWGREFQASAPRHSGPILQTANPA